MHFGEMQLTGSAYFEPQPTPPLRVTAEELLQCHLGDKWQQQLSEDTAMSTSSGSSKSSSWLVIDTRSAEQHTGKVRRGPRGGRIPGSVSLPRSQLLEPQSGWLKPLDEQQQLLESLGVDLDRTGGSSNGVEKVVLYCNGGVAACTAALALERLGYRRWAVYDGSWNEWGQREDLPVEV